MGFYGAGATQNSKLMWDKDGKYIGGNQSIDLQIQMQTRNQALTKVLTDINSGKLSMEEVESLQNQLNTLAGRDQANMWLDKNRNALKLAYNGISDEEADQILNGTHPTIKLEDALHKTAEFMKALNPSMKTGKSPDGILDTITGAIGDFGNFLFMNKYSDDLGYIDPSNGEWVPNTCFPGTEQVKLYSKDTRQEYFTNIRDVRVGDFAKSINEETGEIEYKRVTEIFTHPIAQLFRISYYETESSIETTFNHPFYVESKGWVEARHLQPGMRSVTVSSIENRFANTLQPHIQPVSFGDSRKGLTIKSIERINRREVVYNLEVEGNHTYFVGQDEVLVHNYGGQSRELSQREKEALRSVFGNLLDKVRLKGFNDPRARGYGVHWSNDETIYTEDDSVERATAVHATLEPHLVTMIHEGVHIVQNLRDGRLGSLWRSMTSGHSYENYRLDSSTGKNFGDLGSEQQATAVEEYYMRTNNLSRFRSVRENENVPDVVINRWYKQFQELLKDVKARKN